MDFVKVFTRQDKRLLDVVEKDGRYISKKKYVVNRFGNQADIYLNIYEWLTKEASKIKEKPEDVELPVWVWLNNDPKLPLTEGSVMIEMLIPSHELLVIDMIKWGQITNFSYIPKDLEDKKRHEKMLLDYNTQDAKAIMTTFYPDIKREIINSWSRLFDTNIKHINMAGDEMDTLDVGIIWEVKREWIVQSRSLLHSETP